MPPFERDIIDFRTERSRHEQFLGREDVLAEIDGWLSGLGAAPGWVLVTGQPGMGKSAILRRWLDLAEDGGRPSPHHFLRRGVADWDRPDAVSRSLAAQIERLHPAQADPEARPERRLLDLLGRVSSEVLVPRGERLVLVIDGLDEAAAEPGQNPLPLFLPYALPHGVMALCGSRPTYPHLGWLEARGNVQRIDLDDARWSASNETVCRALWQRWAPAFRPGLDAAFVDGALAAGSGNVLYAVKLREWLGAQPAGERRVSKLPRGLKGLLDQAWADLRRLPREPREAAISGLGVLCAAREALPLSAVEEAAEWGGGDAREDFLGAVRPFLLEEPEQWSGEAAYRLYHESFRELVREKVGAKGMREHHRRLLATVAAWPAAEGARGYALKHAVGHAVAAGEMERAAELCRDVGFLEGWCRAGGVEAIEAGLKEAGEALGDEETKLLHRVVRAESHWLRKDPEALGELVYNRLRSGGWSAEQIQGRVRWGDRLPEVRLRHPVRMGWERTLVGHAGPVLACAVTPDGRHIVSASSDRTLKVWEVDGGRAQATLIGHTAAVNACAVLPDGRRVVSASNDMTLRVWEMSTGKELATLRGHTDGVNGCAALPDGRRVVSASNDGTLRVWDVDSGSALGTFRLPEQVSTCAALPDGRRVLASANDGKLRVWDVDSMEDADPHAVSGHQATIRACALTPDGRRVVSVSYHRMKVWDLESWSELTHLRRDVPVRACAFTFDGHRLLLAVDDVLTVLDVESGDEITTFRGHTAAVRACAVTPDGHCLVSASEDGTLKLWCVEDEAELSIPKAHADPVAACVVTPDGRRVVSAVGKILRVWDAADGRPIADLAGHRSAITACAVTPDGRRIVSASWDETLRVWDLTTGREEAILAGHTNWVNACAVTPDGRRLVSASRDGTLKVWDLEQGRELATLERRTDKLTACAVSPDGRYLVSTSADWTLAVWDMEDERELAALQGHTDRITACAVTPDGRRVVSSSWDRTLRVWDLATGREIATLEGHTDRISACAVTPGGAIVSSSWDRTLRVWDLTTGQGRVVLHGLSIFRSVAVTRDLLCAGDDGGNLWILETSSSPPPPLALAPAPLRLFYSYSPADEPLRAALEKHLANLERRGFIAPWHARLLPAGGEVDREAGAQIERADVILLLVSADFLASDYLDEEMTRALARHRRGEARVLPILVRPVDFSGAPFADLVPADATPVTARPNQDEAWREVAQRIRGAVDDLRARSRGDTRLP